VTVEGDRDGADATLAGCVDRPDEDRTVPEMDPVEEPDRDDRLARRERQRFDASHHVHGGQGTGVRSRSEGQNGRVIPGGGDVQSSDVRVCMAAAVSAYADSSTTLRSSPGSATRS